MHLEDSPAPIVPFLNVSHLPSSTSFYAAVLQPLGFKYINTPCSPGGQSCEAPTTSSTFPPRIVSFGDPSSPRTPVLQLRESASPSEALKISRIVIAAPSPTSVVDFQACALRAFPAACSSSSQCLRLPVPGQAEAKISDFDGNTMEVVYPIPAEYPAHYSGPVVRTTQSTKEEASRILDWNYDVAKRTPSDNLAQRNEGGGTVLRRSVTTSSYEYPVPAPSASQTSGGVSPGAVAGLLGVGVAVGMGVGAALTYSTMKSDRSRAPAQDFDAPVFQRRATYPERLPSERGGEGSRYIEVERSVEKIRYPEEYADLAMSQVPPAPYIAKYSQAGSTARSRVDDMYDGQSRHSSRSFYPESRPGTVHTRSEAAGSRMPLLLTEAEHKSQASSRHSAAKTQTHAPSRASSRAPTTVASTRRSGLGVEVETASHASTRSHKTSVTIRPSVQQPPPASSYHSHHTQASHKSSVTIRPSVQQPPPASSHHSHHTQTIVSRSRSGSTIAATTIKIPAGSHVSMPPSVSRSASHVSARHVPLPRSSVASSYTRDSAWEDAESVAPSDSISCAGSRRSHAYH